MANKNNIRSMRFSDDILAIIEAQPGENFTAKFERLVMTCVQELPKKQNELKYIQDQIAREREQLRTVQRAKSTFTQNLNNLEWSMKYLASQVDQASKALEGIEV